MPHLRPSTELTWPLALRQTSAGTKAPPAKHGDDLHHKRPPVAAIGIGAGDRRLTGALSPSSLTESAGGKDAIVYRAGFSNVAGSLAFRL